MASSWQRNTIYSGDGGGVRSNAQATSETVDKRKEL